MQNLYYQGKESLEQPVCSVIQQPKGPTTSHGLGKTVYPVFEQTNKVPTAEQPCFYYSEQKTSPEEQTVVDPRSHLKFRNPEHSQPHPLTDLKQIKEVHLHYISFQKRSHECGGHGIYNGSCLL